MTTLPFVSGIPSALPLYPQKLELAPEGWRECMNRIAQGFAEVDENQAVCLLCGATLNRGTGHTVDCLTMHARRMMDAELVLHVRHTAAAAQPGLDIDAAHVGQATPCDFSEAVRHVGDCCV
jgi:molybdopterin synthase catalytic subunit